jgi:hypothetical protein
MMTTKGLLQVGDCFCKGDGIQTNNTYQNTSRALKKKLALEEGSKVGLRRSPLMLYIQVLRAKIGVHTEGD